MRKWVIPSVDDAIDCAKKQISKQDLRAFLVVFITGIMMYIPMIIQRLACSDGNICGLLYRPHSDYDVEDIAGRYLIKFVAHIKSLYTFSWLAVILGIFFLTIGSYFVCKILDIDSQIGKVVAGWFIILSPCFLETFPYYFVADIYLLSFPLVCGAVFLLKEKKTLCRMFLSAFLLFVSMTFYQAYLFVAVVLFLFLLVKDIMQQNKSWKQIGQGLMWQISSGILALVVYVLGNKVLKIVGIIHYQESRFNLMSILKPSILGKALLEAYKDFFRYYFTMDFLNNMWKMRYLFNGFFFLIGIVLFLRWIWKKKPDKKHLFALMATISILPVAFMGIAVMNYLEGAPRIMMLPTTCLLYVGIWALWEGQERSEREQCKICGWILYGSTLYLLMIMVIYTSIYQLCMKYYADKTDAMAIRIIERIEEKYPETVSGSPVFICGDVDEGNYPQDYNITQASYILKGTQACDGMFIDNMQGYFAGWNKYIAAHFGIEYDMVWDKAQEIYDSDLYKEMPLFPAEDSIQKNEDGIVVVKCKP